MAKTNYNTINTRALDMLGFLFQAGGPRYPATVSCNRLQREFELSAFQVHYLLRQLEENRLIEKQPRFSEDGGRLSNAYYVTPAGSRALKDGDLDVIRRRSEQV